METHEKEAFGGALNIGVNENTSSDIVKEKRVVKLTPKAFAEKLERLQNERKCKLNKASKLRKNIKDLVNNKGNVSSVEKVFDEFTNVCVEVKGIHCTLICYLMMKGKNMRFGSRQK